ncbi:hypothetical protein CYMTET_49689 [Cymbomonas tetramitiformis]|uniref:Uncharacterized protein n=1 Tax=Cymbomonas tetramitiformis TaxID=36881 RepID=A0AAE0BRC2_9CHLO|nr:hypothetical protein CYMTET_49689 [Cymbomonas tetramitiformis]
MGKKKNALVGRNFHLFKEDWPQYSNDKRKRRPSGRNLSVHSIAGGSRVLNSPGTAAGTPVRTESEHRLILEEGESVTPTKLSALQHALPPSRQESVSTAVHTTPQKRRVEDKSKWKRARKRALGFKFLAELKPQEELCPPTCNFQCDKVPMAHRVALREQLNQEYKSRGKRGVSSFLNRLIHKKDTSKVRASRGYLTTRESAKKQVAGMRCKYCRLGIGTVAVGVVPLPRNHNFTALARRVLSRRKLPLDEAEETGETHAQVVRVLGCPHFDEGTAYFETLRQEYVRTLQKKGRADFVLPPDSKSISGFPVCWQFFRNTFGLGKDGKIVKTLLQECHSQVFPNQTPANRGAEIAKARGLLTMNKVKDHIKLFPRWVVS